MKRLTNDEFIARAISIHGNRYDYASGYYKQYQIKTLVVCRDHGDFLISPANHLKGRGCPKCKAAKLSLLFKDSLDTFIKKANIVHDSEFVYDKSVYINQMTKICIVCKKHGDFYQTPNKHLQGQKCPNCITSRGENKIKSFLLLNDIHFTQQHRFKLCKNERPLPFDFYIPSLNTCIEFDGEQHFRSGLFGDCGVTQFRDAIKTNFCIDNGIKLIRISYVNFSDVDCILGKELAISN
jgi:very-short-patch-repair endonuclease